MPPKSSKVRYLYSFYCSLFCLRFYFGWNRGEESRGSILVSGLRNEDPCRGKPDTPEQERSHPTGMEGTSCLLLLLLEASPTPSLRLVTAIFPCIWEYQNAHYCASSIGTIRVITASHFALLCFVLFCLELQKISYCTAYLTVPPHPIYLS